MRALRILDYESHSGNEWVTVGYRRWWCPWVLFTKSLFSGPKYELSDFTDEHGRYVKATRVRDLLTRYKAEQQIAEKLLEERNLPEGAVIWRGILEDKTAYSGENIFFRPDPEDRVGHHSWLINAKGLPQTWIGQRVRITMEKIT